MAEALAIDCTSRWANPLDDVYLSAERFDDALDKMQFYGNATSAIATTIRGKPALVKVDVSILSEDDPSDPI